MKRKLPHPIYPPPYLCYIRVSCSCCISEQQDPSAALATDLSQLSLSGGAGTSAVGSVGSIGGASGGGRTARGGGGVTASRAGVYAGPASRAVQGQSFSLQDVRKGGPGPASRN